MWVKVAQGKAAGYIGPHIMDLMYWDLILDLVRCGTAVGNPYPYSWCELLEKASNITNIHRHLARAYLILNPFHGFKSSLVASYRVLRSRASTMLFLVVQYEYRYLPAAVLVPQESEGPVY